MTQPITGWEDALLRAVNASETAQQTIEDMIADGARRPDEETMEMLGTAKENEEAARAYLEANCPKCPGCQEAYAFMRQEKKPNRCRWCGYDHDTGEMAQLVPASDPFDFFKRDDEATAGDGVPAAPR